MTPSNIPSIRFSILLMLLFVVPYLTRHYYMEVYPSLILPSGPKSLDLTEKNISVINYESYYFSKGEIFSVSNSQLLKSIPIEYHNMILNSDLGFVKYNIPFKKEINIMGEKIDIAPWNKINTERTNDLKKWYYKNINNEADSIKIIKKEIFIERLTGKKMNSKILKEKTYSLK